MNKQDIAAKFLEFQLKRLTTRLLKTYIENIEDIRVQHELMITKLKDLAPADKVDLINFFNDKYFENLRKRCLDIHGDTQREIVNLISEFELITFNGNR